MLEDIVTHIMMEVTRNLRITEKETIGITAECIIEIRVEIIDGDRNTGTTKSIDKPRET
jgi:hypothetical protein